MLPAWIWPVLDLWAISRQPGPFGPVKLLPCGGAPSEQPAALMDALAMIDAMVEARNGSP